MRVIYCPSGMALSQVSQPLSRRKYHQTAIDLNIDWYEVDVCQYWSSTRKLICDLWGSLNAKDVFEVLSFLKWEFKSERLRE